MNFLEVKSVINKYCSERLLRKIDKQPKLFVLMVSIFLINAS